VKAADTSRAAKAVEPTKATARASAKIKAVAAMRTEGDVGSSVIVPTVIVPLKAARRAGRVAAPMIAAVGRTAVTMIVRAAIPVRDKARTAKAT